VKRERHYSHREPFRSLNSTGALSLPQAKYRNDAARNSSCLNYFSIIVLNIYVGDASQASPVQYCK